MLDQLNQLIISNGSNGRQIPAYKTKIHNSSEANMKWTSIYYLLNDFALNEYSKE